MDDLVDRTEAARIAGISVSTLQSHRFPGEHTRKTPFPEPAATFGRVPVWHRADVERWSHERDAKRGRKPTP